MRKQVSLKTYLASILLISVLFVSMITYIWANPSSTEIPIEKYSFSVLEDYIIFKNHSIYYARNGSTGELECSSSDFVTTIQWTHDQLTNGGTIGVKNLGNVVVETKITLSNNDIEIEFEKGSVFRPNIDGMTLFEITTDGVIIEGLYTRSYGARRFNPVIKAEGSFIMLYSSTSSATLGVDLSGQDSKLLFNTFSSCNTAILKNNTKQDIIGNHLDGCTTGIWVRQADFDLLEANFINGGTTGLKLEDMGQSKYVAVVGGKIMDASTNVLCNDTGATLSITGTRLEDAPNYNLRVVDGLALANGLNMKCLSSGTAIMLEGGTLDLIGVIVSGAGTSFNQTGGVIHSDACYSFDGLLENLLENYGTATISDSTTTTFTHGLAGQPDYMWASFNSTAYNGYTWTANSTHATITVGTSGNYTVYWHGIYEP